MSTDTPILTVVPESNVALAVAARPKRPIEYPHTSRIYLYYSESRVEKDGTTKVHKIPFASFALHRTAEDSDLFVGVSMCSPMDQFRYAKARGIASGRAQKRVSRDDIAWSARIPAAEAQDFIKHVLAFRDGIMVARNDQLHSLCPAVQEFCAAHGVKIREWRN